MAKDYYKILGVDKSASPDDIKKAFRKLAHEYHPDKQGGNADKFKEASEAYSVLSDEGKRKQYDTFGSAGAGFNPGQGGGQGFGGFDFSGFSQQYGQGGGTQGFEFDLGDLFGEFFGGGGRQRNKRGSDISVDIRITFSEAVFGVEKDITITKASTCSTCKGTGGKPGVGTKTCETCHGKGKVQETRRSIMGTFATTRTCETCHGSGQVPKEKCEICHGSGVVESTQTLAVRIPPGINDGEMVRLSGMGEAVSGGQPGDLYVKIHVERHPVFVKEGDNLLMNLRVKLSSALVGEEVTIRTLDGDLVVKVPEGTNHGDILRIKGKGVPHERGNRRGDILITVHVDMPKKLSKAARKAIDELRNEGI